MVKNLPETQKIQVRSLGQENCPGERNGNQLQYSCQKNPVDRGAWWATVLGVTQLDTAETNTFTFFQVTSLILFLTISIIYIFSSLLALKFLMH